MSDGDNLEFDEFELPGDEEAQSPDDATIGETEDGPQSIAEFDNLDDLPEGPELSGIDAFQADESGSDETADEAELVDVSAVITDVPDDSEAPAPSKSKLKLDLPTLAAFGASGLVLAGLGYVNLIAFGGWPVWCIVFLNAIGLTGVAIPFLLWAGRSSLSVYDVILSVTLAAILVGSGLLLLELVAYKGDVFAKEKSLQSSLPRAVQAAPPNTTAVA